MHITGAFLQQHSEKLVETDRNGSYLAAISAQTWVLEGPWTSWAVTKEHQESRISLEHADFTYMHWNPHSREQKEKLCIPIVNACIFDLTGYSNGWISYYEKGHMVTDTVLVAGHVAPTSLSPSFVTASVNLHISHVISLPLFLTSPFLFVFLSLASFSAAIHSDS